MLTAILMTTAAGLSTGLGGLAALLSRRPTNRLLCFSQGFAGGVMLTVSLSDMLPHAVEGYRAVMGRPRAAGAAVSLFFLGMIVALLLQGCLPEPKPEKLALAGADRNAGQLLRAARSAIITTAVILLHNLPEGILTLFTGYANPEFGLTLTLAIALHNIPEGIAVSIPVCYATGSRWKGIALSLLSGLAEPVGALAAFFLFRGVITPLFLNGLVAAIAGIMSFVSISELLPESFAGENRAAAVAGVTLGVLVMSGGIYLL